MRHRMSIGVALLYSLLMVLAVPAICAAAKPAPEPPPVVSVSSVYGFQFTQTSPPTVTSGPGISTGDGRPIALGAYADKGKGIVGGDYVLEVYLHLGTAPLAQVWLPTDITVTTADPWAAGVAPPMVITVDSGAGFEPEMWVAGFPIGSEGDYYFGFALKNRKDQPLTEALGVTLPYHVRIGETQGFLYGPDGNLRFTTTMTPGGAAYFDQGHGKKGHGNVVPVLQPGSGS